MMYAVKVMRGQDMVGLSVQSDQSAAQAVYDAQPVGGRVTQVVLQPGAVDGGEWTDSGAPIASKSS